VVDVYAYGVSTHLIVDRVLPRRGVAGFSLGLETEARNIFVGAAAFEQILRSGLADGAPPRWAVAVSNRGGVESGADLTAPVSRLLRGDTGLAAAQVEQVKKIALDQADATGKGFRDMFTATGAFGVLAGLLLLVNLFVMLAAERKPELGMARAVGMRRSALVGAFATEGFLYAVVATALGTLVGIGLGRILVFASERAFNTEHSRFDLFFTLDASSLAVAFAFSFAVALATIAATSARISRLNIIRAIRDIPEPPPQRGRRWFVAGAATAALAALWSVVAIPADDPYGLLLGPALLLLGLAPALARLMPGPRTPSLLAALVLVWASYS
jgi:putative ABC transport system permease protein